LAGHLLGLWYDPFEHVFDYWGDARETADQPGRYDTGDLQGPQDVVEYWAAKWVACLARKDPDDPEPRRQQARALAAPGHKERACRELQAALRNGRLPRFWPQREEAMESVKGVGEACLPA